MPAWLGDAAASPSCSGFIILNAFKTYVPGKEKVSCFQPVKVATLSGDGTRMYCMPALTPPAQNYRLHVCLMAGMLQQVLYPLLYAGNSILLKIELRFRAAVCQSEAPSMKRVAEAHQPSTRLVYIEHLQLPSSPRPHRLQTPALVSQPIRWSFPPLLLAGSRPSANSCSTPLY